MKHFMWEWRTSFHHHHHYQINRDLYFSGTKSKSVSRLNHHSSDVSIVFSLVWIPTWLHSSNRNLSLPCQALWGIFCTTASVSEGKNSFTLGIACTSQTVSNRPSPLSGRWRQFPTKKCNDSVTQSLEKTWIYKGWPECCQHCFQQGRFWLDRAKQTVSSLNVKLSKPSHLCSFLFAVQTWDWFQSSYLAPANRQICIFPNWANYSFF